MFDRMGRRGYVMPIIIVIVFACMFSLMFWPMTHMQIKNLPFAIVSLDEGAEMAGQEVNIGDTIVDSIIESTDTSDDDEDPMMTWTRLDGADELNEAVDNVEYYGIMVIPEDYSEALVEAQMASMTQPGTDTSSGIDTTQLEALAAQSGMDVSQLQTMLASAADDPSQLNALAAQLGMDASQLQALLGQSGTDATSGIDTTQLEALAAQSGMDVSQLQTMLASVADDPSQLEALAAQLGMDASQLQALVAQSGTDATTEGATSEGTELDASSMLSSMDMSLLSSEDMPAISMLLDNAKSPLIANMMQTSVATMFSSMGMNVEVEVIHNGVDDAEDNGEEEAGTGSFDITNMYGMMMSQQLAIMPVCMISMMGCMFLARIFSRKKAATKAEAWKAVGKQVLYALGLSLLTAIAALIMVICIAGTEVPIVEGCLFLWIATFCLMLVFLGLYNIAFGLGLVGGFCISMLGMMTGIMPPEMLPTFWSDFIYPWAPQHFVSGGLRLIEFVDGGVFNTYTWAFLIYAVAGIVLLLIAAVLPTKAQREAKNNFEFGAHQVRPETATAQEAQDIQDVQQTAKHEARNVQDVRQTAKHEVRDDSSGDA